MPGKKGQIRPSNAVRTREMAAADRTCHLGYQPLQKTPTIHASSGFIGGNLGLSDWIFEAEHSR
jgi:hypothetical protein